MKLAVVGSRDLVKIPDLARQSMRDYLTRYRRGITEIVSGGARGADTYAEEIAAELGIPTKIFPADWNKYGKGAGFIRNKEIVDYADAVVAFYYGSSPSRGAQNTINQARAQNMLTKEIFVDKNAA